MSRLRTNRVCFTINNYEEKTLTEFEEFFASDEKIKYGICAQEIGENGTPHLQGFLHYKEDRKKCGIKFWKELVPMGARAHFEAAKGKDEDSQTYCRKEGVFIEAGSPGAADKYAEILDLAKTDPEAALYLDPHAGLRFYSAIMQRHRAHKTYKTLDRKLPVLRDWQAVAMQKLQSQSDRQILFIVDPKGGKGKSTLGLHIKASYNAWKCEGKRVHIQGGPAHGPHGPALTRSAAREDRGRVLRFYSIRRSARGVVAAAQPVIRVHY